MTACANERGPEWAGTIEEIDGVTVVANSAEGIWAPGEEWILEEELRIGAIEGDPNYQFAMVSGIAIGRDGTIHVLDMQDSTVRSYDAQGTFLRRFGGRGSGPGEIGVTAVGILRTAGDTLLVPDATNQRVNHYTSDGRSAGSSPLDLTAGLPLLWRSTAGGDVVRQVRPIGLMGGLLRSTLGVQGEADSLDILITFTPGSTAADTLLRFPSGEMVGSSGGALPTMEMFAKETMWDVSDDLSIILGTNDEYQIDLYREGRLSRSFTKPFTARPVTEADRTAILDAMMQVSRNQGMPPAALAMIRTMTRFAETYPAFGLVHFGGDGAVWVQQMESAEEAAARAGGSAMNFGGSSNWDVFDDEGRYLGVTRMPAGFTPSVFLGDRIYGVALDELEVPYVVRLRVVRP